MNLPSLDCLPSWKLCLLTVTVRPLLPLPPLLLDVPPVWESLEKGFDVELSKPVDFKIVPDFSRSVDNAMIFLR